MKTIGLLPQRQLIQIDSDDVTDDDIRALFGMGDASFQRVPFEDTPRPAEHPDGLWIEGPYEWLEDRVRRVWTLRPWSSQELFGRVVKAGYLVEPEGCYLALGERDVDAFTQLAALLPLQLSQGSITALTLHKIKDKNDQVHQFTTTRLLEVLAGYGAYVKSLWDAALPS